MKRYSQNRRQQVMFSDTTPEKVNIFITFRQEVFLKEPGVLLSKTKQTTRQITLDLALEDNVTAWS